MKEIDWSLAPINIEGSSTPINFVAAEAELPIRKTTPIFGKLSFGCFKLPHDGIQITSYGREITLDGI